MRVTAKGPARETVLAVAPVSLPRSRKYRKYGEVKTTLEIPHSVFRRAKAKALSADRPSELL